MPEVSRTTPTRAARRRASCACRYARAGSGSRLAATSRRATASARSPGRVLSSARASGSSWSAVMLAGMPGAASPAWRGPDLVREEPSRCAPDRCPADSALDPGRARPGAPVDLAGPPGPERARPGASPTPDRARPGAARGPAARSRAECPRPATPAAPDRGPSAAPPGRATRPDPDRGRADSPLDRGRPGASPDARATPGPERGLSAASPVRGPARAPQPARAWPAPSGRRRSRSARPVPARQLSVRPVRAPAAPDLGLPARATPLSPPRRDPPPRSPVLAPSPRPGRASARPAPPNPPPSLRGPVPPSLRDPALPVLRGRALPVLRGRAPPVLRGRAPPSLRGRAPPVRERALGASPDRVAARLERSLSVSGAGRAPRRTGPEPPPDRPVPAPRAPARLVSARGALALAVPSGRRPAAAVPARLSRPRGLPSGRGAASLSPARSGEPPSRRPRPFPATANLPASQPAADVVSQHDLRHAEGRYQHGSGPQREDVRRRPTLPRGPPRSTIGAEGLNFRVRNGTGCFPFAMAAETLWRCQVPRPHLGNRTVDACNIEKVEAKPLGLLVPVSYTRRRASTSGLSTQSSSWGPYRVNPEGDLILRRASRLDAFSGYPFRT